tara:strand:+ start:2672 stop:2977 length:306 start_codon:yes stop_codon:yes gene_type:complete
MAFKLKGMFFGEGTGSALKNVSRASVVMPLFNTLLNKAGGAAKDVLVGGVKDHISKSKKKKDDESTVVNNSAVDWDDNQKESFTTKMEDVKKAMNVQKEYS